MNNHYVYGIRLPTDDYRLAYIGYSKNPKNRFLRHLRSPQPIGIAIRESGSENCIFEILGMGSKLEMLRQERLLMLEYRTYWPHGYNNAQLYDAIVPTAYGRPYVPTRYRRDLPRVVRLV